MIDLLYYDSVTIEIRLVFNSELFIQLVIN